MFFFRMVRRKRRRRACFTLQAPGPLIHSFFPKIKWILEIRHFGYFSLGCFRYEFCHLWVRFWDGSWCVVNLKSYSFQNGYGYVQEAKISAREAQLPIRSEKHLKLKFWQTSRFLNVFSDFPLVQATLDVDVARCECDINMVVGALYTLGLTLSKHDMIKFASVALRAEGGAFSWTFSRF